MALKKSVTKNAPTPVVKKRNPRVQSIIDRINKDYGANTIVMASEAVGLNYTRSSCGSFGLDRGLGGGLCFGRIHLVIGKESACKTALSLISMGIIQRKYPDCVVMYVDAERTFDRKKATELGVDLERMMILNPDSLEQGGDVVQELLEEGVLKGLVIDSWAALVPTAEYADDMEKGSMGRNALAKNKFVRKMVAATKKDLCSPDPACLIMIINHINMNIGVTWGCFDYRSRVSLADGTTRCIGTIVNNKEKLKVKTYNIKTKRVEDKRIVGWHNNGKLGKHLYFETQGRGSGKNKFKCTANHELFSPKNNSFVLANDVQEGDFLAVHDSYLRSSDTDSILLGSLLGDGYFRKGKILPLFRIKHGRAQKEYCLWKASMLGEPYTITEASTYIEVNFKTSSYFRIFRDLGYKEDGTRIITQGIIDRLDLRSLAIWHMDDANLKGAFKREDCHGGTTISVKSYSDKDILKLCSGINKKFGLSFVANLKYKRLYLSGEDNIRYLESIAPYVHPSMEYKLPPKFRGLFSWEKKQASVEETTLVPVRVLKKEERAKAQDPYRYDLTIEGNSNYFVGNCLVHNSPETDTGGMGKNYLASIRIKQTRIENIKVTMDGQDHIVGIRVKWDITKNKTDVPYKTGMYDYYFATTKTIKKLGIDRTGEIIEYAKKWKLIPDGMQRKTFESQYLGTSAYQSLQNDIMRRENATHKPETEQQIKVDPPRKKGGKKAR